MAASAKFMFDEDFATGTKPTITVVEAERRAADAEAQAHRKGFAAGQAQARSEAEQRIADLAAELSALYNGAPCGYHSLDESGLFVRINDTELAMLGYRREELEGMKTFFDLATEESRQQFEANFQVLAKTGRLDNLEIGLRRKDGSIQPLLTHALAVYDQNGRFCRGRFSVIDISDYKKAEAERVRAEETLRGSVVALRHSLAEKEVLLREIHHRVKNNLQIITSLLRLQGRQSNDPATKQMLLESENRIQSMGAIHENLYRASDFSRVNLAEYLRRVVNQLAASYQKAGVTCAVMGDEVLIVTTEVAMPCGLIVNELVSNALKHGFCGMTGKVAVTVRRQEGVLTLAVEDNGSGLPESFDIASRTGLGLQLVRTLTTQLNGVLRVSGERPTKFEIEFEAASTE